LRNAARRGGEPIALEQELLGVTGVAGEQLVAPVARQEAGLAVFPCQTRAVIGGHGGGIAEGLIVAARDERDGIDDVLGGDLVLVHAGAEVASGDAGVIQLVVARFVETDGIGVGGLAAHPPQHAGDGGAVGATGEEGPHRPFGLTGHPPFQELQQLGAQGLEGNAAGLLVMKAPIAPLGLRPR